MTEGQRPSPGPPHDPRARPDWDRPRPPGPPHDPRARPDWDRPQPPGPPPPANVPPPTQPAGDPFEPGRRKRRIWPWIVLAVLAPVLLVGGCVTAIFLAARGPIDTANEYLVLLDEQRWDDAYDALAPGCQVESRDQFVAVVSPLDITGYRLTSTEVVNSQGAASGTITLASGQQLPIEFDVVKVDGEWRVCGFSFGN